MVEQQFEALWTLVRIQTEARNNPSDQWTVLWEWPNKRIGNGTLRRAWA